MIVTIHQPMFIPYAGVFAKMLHADKVVVYDTAQYAKGSMYNRNKLLHKDGWRWLTLPVSIKEWPLRCFEVEVADQPFREKHVKTIQQVLGRAEHFHEVWRLIEGAYYRRDGLSFSEFCTAIWRSVLARIQGPEVVMASEVDSDFSGDASERLVRLTRLVGGDVYLSGEFGRTYLDTTKFDAAGISVRFGVYTESPYRQVYPGFSQHMSVLDMLANLGAEEMRKKLQQDYRCEF